MTKSGALKMFGETRSDAVKRLAEALGISRQAIYQWPDDLPQDTVDRVVGAAVRTGRWKEQGAAA